MAWYDERDLNIPLESQPRKRDWSITGQGFKAKGHGTWAWRKGMRADRNPMYVVDHRNEKHVWMRPTSGKRRRTIRREGIQSYGIDSRGVIEIPADA